MIDLGFLKAFLWQQATIYSLHNQRDQQLNIEQTCHTLLQKTEDILTPAWEVSKVQAVCSI